MSINFNKYLKYFTDIASELTEKIVGNIKRKLRVTSSNPQVTSSNQRVKSLNPQATSSNPRVRTIKIPSCKIKSTS